MGESSKASGTSMINRPKKKRIVFLMIVAVIVAGLLSIGGYQVYLVLQDFGFVGGWHEPRGEANVKSAIECTLIWGRLAPIPEEARDFVIETAGSAFTRSFRATFVADPDVIERWLTESPGTSEVEPERPKQRVRHFQIRPGNGAALAEVTVDDETHRVRIEVWWS